MTLREGPARERLPGPAAVEYLVFDLETTGLGERCQVVEFAGIVLNPELGKIAVYETLVNPGCAPGPTWLHGLDQSILESAPSFEDVAGDIARLFSDRVPVAHNLRFDWSVLRRSFSVLGVELPLTPGGVCTATVARQVLADASRLERVCHYLGVTYTTPHRARPDAAATVDVFRTLRAMAPKLTAGRPCPVFSGAWRLHASLPALRRSDIPLQLGSSGPVEKG